MLTVTCVLGFVSITGELQGKGLTTNITCERLVGSMGSQVGLQGAFQPKAPLTYIWKIIPFSVNDNS